MIEQALGLLQAEGKRHDAYYFRTSDQHELDLVIDFGRELWAVEIKLTSSPKPDDMARLNKAADMIHASRRFLVSQTRSASGDRRRVSCGLQEFLDRLRRFAARR